MYQSHESFRAPDDEQATIWRYMDFTKYVSLLEQRGLFFVNSRYLEDPYEGTVPEILVEQFPGLKELAGLREQYQSVIGINSWHMSEYESAAMWKVFANESEGIAIKSSYASLRDCFADASEAVFIGVVQYLDYSTDDLGIALEAGLQVFDYYLRKRRSFDYERELRAATFLAPGMELVGDKGAYVRVILEVLIEGVYVSPGAAGWFLELVRAVTERYGVVKDVIQSSLLEGPVY